MNERPELNPAPRASNPLLVDGLFSPSGRWLAGSVVLAAILIPPSLAHGGPVLCLFRRWTDLLCLGCGLTRAFVHTGHLEFQQGLNDHLFGPPLFFILLSCSLLAMIPAARRQRLGASSLRRTWSAVEPAVLAAWFLWAGLRLLGF